VGIEEAVANGDVDRVGDRLAKAGNDLPRESRVGIIDDRAGVREGADVVIVDAGNADTAADEAADAIVIAKVEHAVDHEAERAGAPAAGRLDRRSRGEANRGATNRIARRTDRIFDV